MAAGNDELVLLERVFLRIGSANTDEELEKVLAKFLPPVLLKLSSQGEGVRKKVMELLVHVNKRVKSLSKVKLPVTDLIDQYMDPNVSPFVTNFTILYIKMGFPRLDLDNQKSLLPMIMKCVPGKPEPQQYTLLQLAVPVFAHITLPNDRKEKRALFGLEDHPDMIPVFLCFLKDVLLLPYSIASYQSKPAATPDGDGEDDLPPQPNAPPGLSEASFKQVTGDTPPTADQLEKNKMGVLRLLGADIFEESTIVVPLAVASADTRHGQFEGSDDWSDVHTTGRCVECAFAWLLNKDN